MDKERKRRLRDHLLIVGGLGVLFAVAFFHGEAGKVSMEVSAITLAHLLAQDLI